jgi:hypothetical protein
MKLFFLEKINLFDCRPVLLLIAANALLEGNVPEGGWNFSNRPSNTTLLLNNF